MELSIVFNGLIFQKNLMNDISLLQYSSIDLKEIDHKFAIKFNS
jgi:hypothetical protein